SDGLPSREEVKKIHLPSGVHAGDSIPIPEHTCRGRAPCLSIVHKADPDEHSETNTMSPAAAATVAETLAHSPRVNCRRELPSERMRQIWGAPSRKPSYTMLSGAR